MATDADLRAAAELLRQNGYEARHPEVVTSPDEQVAIDVERKLRSGGAATPGEEPTPDPTSAAEYRKDIAAGYGPEASQRRAIQRLFNAAVDGDERAIYDADRSKLASDGYVDGHGVVRLH